MDEKDGFRQRFIMIAHYFPRIDLKNISDDEFAMWSENAQWFHSQQLMVQQANSVGLLGGGPKQT